MVSRWTIVSAPIGVLLAVGTGWCVDQMTAAPDPDLGSAIVVTPAGPPFDPSVPLGERSPTPAPDSPGTPSPAARPAPSPSTRSSHAVVVPPAPVQDAGDDDVDDDTDDDSDADSEDADDTDE